MVSTVCMLRRVRQAYLFSGSLRFTVIILVLIFGMVFVGTILQAERGIYWVKQHVFNGWIGRGLLALFILNLLFSFLQRFSEIRHPLGLVVAHLGLVVLILGGFGDLFSRYYVLGIWEGQEADRVFYSNRWELVLRPASVLDGDSLQQAPNASVRESYSLGRLEGANRLRGRTVEFSAENLPGIRIVIEDFLVNARPDSSGNYAAAKWEDSSSANLPLLRGRLFIGSDEKGMATTIWAGNPLGIEFPVLMDGRPFSLSLRLEPVSRLLPFRISLENFSAEFHPSTEIPRSFTSMVFIEDDIETEHRISMNNPLRYRGFVFYQDSYQFDEQGRAASIFAVRETGGALLPYIGTVMGFAGFLLHYLSRKSRTASKLKKRAGAA